MANDDLCDGHRVLVITALNFLLMSPEPTTHPHCIPSMRKAEAPGGVMTYLRLLPARLLREPCLAPSTHEANGPVFTHLEVISIRYKDRREDCKVFGKGGSRGDREQKPGYPW